MTSEKQRPEKKKREKQKLERQRREKLGHRAEFMAAAYLRLKGYKILARRFKTKAGEIDLVAAKKDILIIVEVKARKTEAAARESISYDSKKRIERAADIFIGRHPYAQKMGLRFDAVFLIAGRKIRHEIDFW